MTRFEYAFQDPNEALIVDPFEYGDNDDVRALAVRVIPPALAAHAAEDMLRVRTAILREVEAPKEVLARYDPKTETINQVRYITQASPGTHYLSAAVGSSIHVQKLAERDERGIPMYTGQAAVEIDPELPDDIKEYLDQQLEQRRAKERTVEEYLQTIGLAKVSYTDEEGLRILALDVHPKYRRQSVGSLLLYKAFGMYGNHAGVQPRPSKPEVQFYGVDDTSGYEPLIVQAKIPKFDEQLPEMLESIGMAHDGYEYLGELRTVQQTLTEKLTQRGLIEPADA